MLPHSAQFPYEPLRSLKIPKPSLSFTLVACRCQSVRTISCIVLWWWLMVLHTIRSMYHSTFPSPYPTICHLFTDFRYRSTTFHIAMPAMFSRQLWRVEAAHMEHQEIDIDRFLGSVAWLVKRLFKVVNHIWRYLEASGEYKSGRGAPPVTLNGLMREGLIGDKGMRGNGIRKGRSDAAQGSPDASCERRNERTQGPGKSNAYLIYALFGIRFPFQFDWDCTN